MRTDWDGFRKMIEGLPTHWLPATLFVLVDEMVKRDILSKDVLELMEEKIRWNRKNSGEA